LFYTYRKAPVNVGIVLCLFSSVFAYSGGTGNPNNPYKIANVADFNQLTLDPNNWNKSFILTADINLAGLTFTNAPIAPDTSPNSGFQGTQFTGSFDGNGHIIRNLTYTTTASTGYVGLFGSTSNAAIRNLGIEDVNIHTGGGRTGGLVGEQDNGTITSCYTTGSVTSTPSSYAYAGGLVGYQNYGTIASCHSTVTVVSTTKSSAINGGLVGWQFNGSIAASYSTGNVVATSNSATAYAGGLVGSQSYGAGPITSCYSTGNVVSTANGPSYAGSSVDVFAGGLVAACSGSVVNCYSTGQVSATGNHFVYKGGLLGYNIGTVTASVWDVNTSGLAASAGGTGKTTAEMKTLSTFTSAGWDFLGESANGTKDYWRMCVDGLNYPKLSWQFLPGDFVCPDGVDIYDLAVFADQWLLKKLSFDTNNDGIVNFLDFAIFANNWHGDMNELAQFASQWLQRSATNADIAPAPGGDGIVNFIDFALFADNWLEGR
jgi:hypothetical protein